MGMKEPHDRLPDAQSPGPILEAIAGGSLSRSKFTGVIPESSSLQLSRGSLLSGTTVIKVFQDTAAGNKSLGEAETTRPKVPRMIIHNMTSLGTSIRAEEKSYNVKSPNFTPPSESVLELPYEENTTEICRKTKPNINVMAPNYKHSAPASIPWHGYSDCS